ncbi:MAG TPA: septum formation protein Maf [Desulfonatronum sp.]|nr:septum formation protein Maf [Desulfonatronum sp.]
MFIAVMPLVLGSGSPRRKELLQGLGLLFSIHPAKASEPEFVPGTDPEEYALSAAAAKAREVAESHPNAVILAADTIVVVDGDVLGKPRNSAEALAMLSRLAGREHQVITGCSIVARAEAAHARHEACFAVRTKVWMADFDEGILAAYVATGEPLDKAGAYGIQERAAFLVERIEGSYTNVVGLPLAEVALSLRRAGFIQDVCGVSAR